jgi:uncharacterized membrane protein
MGENGAAPARPPRIESVDLIRGLVMVIMALDHVRDFFGSPQLQDPTNLEATTPQLFFTRWITHFCAPTFIFLAGTGAFLSSVRGKSKPELSWFLFTRGLWFAFFEVVINRIFWMFSFDFVHHGAGVFWAIGWAMVVLSWLVYLPAPAVGFIGVLIVTLHNTLDNVTASQLRIPEWLWEIMHKPGDAPMMQVYFSDWTRMLLMMPGDPAVPETLTFGTGYCLIPWIGVMAAGYGFGSILQLEPTSRKKCLLHVGASLTLAFIILRLSNAYGDPSRWSLQKNNLFTFMSFLNCTKYPASLLYLLMTLGPAIFLIGVFDRPLGPLAKPLLVFGRVPMFYYILHIPLIHGGAVLLDYLRFGWSPLANHGPWGLEKLPPDYGVSLGYVYLIWIGVVLLLYFPCRWFAEVKRRHRSAWLSYI